MDISNSISNFINGFDNKVDIIKVLNKIYSETQENRQRSKEMYETLISKIVGNDSNLISIAMLADKYLDQMTKQTELLVKLSAVMQKLNTETESGNIGGDFKELLEKLDEQQITPFKK